MASDFWCRGLPREWGRVARQSEILLTNGSHEKKSHPRGTKNSDGSKVFLLSLELRKVFKVQGTQSQTERQEFSENQGGRQVFLLTEPKGHMLRKNSRDSFGLEKLEGDFPARKNGETRGKRATVTRVKTPRHSRRGDSGGPTVDGSRATKALGSCWVGERQKKSRRSVLWKIQDHKVFLRTGSEYRVPILRMEFIYMGFEHIGSKRSWENLRNPRKENPDSLYKFTPRCYSQPPDRNLSKLNFRFTETGDWM